MRSINVHPDSSALATAIASLMSIRVSDIQAAGRRPSVVLTGGTIAIDVYSMLDANAVDWTNVDYYWGDERFVPEGHPDRNDQQAKDAFLTRCGVPAERIHAMPTHGCDLSTAEAADSYGDLLTRDPFDLVLLGMGPDGHVASLFPGYEQLHETHRRAVEVFDSPKPPPVRITLTYPTLNNADAVWFLVAGEAKAEAAARALGDTTIDQTPASGVTGTTETLWLLDEAAASRLGD